MNRELLASQWLPIILVGMSFGCTRSCDRDKPYVPYRLTSASASTSVSAPISSTSTNVQHSRFPLRASSVTPPSEKLNIDGHAIRAPEGMRFRWLLRSDVDGDSKPDLFAWASEKTSGVGLLIRELSTTHPNAGPTTVYATSQSALHPGCSVSTRLQQVGPKHLQVSETFKCPPSDPLDGARWWTVLYPGRGSAGQVRFSLPGHESTLQMRASTRDVDNDGLEDIELRVSLRRATGHFQESQVSTIEVPLLFLDRPAGLSRDEQEPARTFRALVARVRRYAAMKSRRSSAAPLARQTSALYATLCQEAPASVARVNGSTVRCGEHQTPALLSGYAADAALRDNNLATALGLLQHVGEVTDDMRVNDKKLARALTPVLRRWNKTVSRVKSSTFYLPFAPSKFSDERLQWNALGFDEEGLLNIVTDVALVRVDPTTRLPVASDDASAPSWSLSLSDASSPLASLKVWKSCPAGPLFVAPSPEGTNRTWLPVSTALLGCDNKSAASGTSQQTLHTTVLGKRSASIQLLIAGVPVWWDSGSGKSGLGLRDLSTGKLGGSWSLNGNYLAIASRFGILVHSKERDELWKPELRSGRFSQLSDCVVSNDGRRVACANHEHRRVRILLRSEK